MKVGDEELSTFVAYALLHPVVELLEGLLLFSFFGGPHFIEIRLGDFFQLVVILQLHAKQFSIVVAHMPEEMGEFVRRKFDLQN